MKNIGKNIKTIRKTKGMTQEAMAEALYVTRQTVSNYENGRSRPDLDMLLKIAEILETDVNTVIYGPAMPQRKKDSYKWLFISAGVLLALTALYAVLSILFPSNSIFGYQHSVRLINQLAVLPVVMFVLGWTLTHCLSIIGNLQQLRPEKVRVCRVILLILLGLLVAIPIPYIIFFGIACYRSLAYHSVSMTFPYVPVFQEAFRAIEFIIYKAPFVYIIIGSICWLFSLPPVQKKTDDPAK